MGGKRASGRKWVFASNWGAGVYSSGVSNIVSVSELQADCSGQLRRAEEEGIVPVSRNGRTVAFLVSRSKFAAILETLDLQKDAGLKALVAQDRAGKLEYDAVPDEA